MHKSVFDRFIADPRSAEVKATLHEPSERILTPATFITVLRPVFGMIAAEKNIHHKKGTFKYVAAMGFSDGADGALSRWIDRTFPNSGLGTSKFGAKADTVADPAGAVPVSVSTLVSERVPLAAKAGVAAVLTQEAAKINWARQANRDFLQAGGDEQLFIQPTKEGKAAMAEKFACLGVAALASEFDSPTVKHVLGAVALYFGVTGALRGNEQVGLYKTEAAELTRQLQTTNDMPWQPDYSQAQQVITLP